jgi:hypothetical protein
MDLELPSHRRAVGGILLLVVFYMAAQATVSPWGAHPPPNPQGEARNLASLTTQPEAREWLRANGHEAPFASNRFKGKDDALAFVAALYEAGAIKVVIDDINDDAVERKGGGPYADALVVRMPADQAQRRRLLAIAKAESERVGEPVADVGRETLYFWWD